MYIWWKTKNHTSLLVSNWENISKQNSTWYFFKNEKQKWVFVSNTQEIFEWSCNIDTIIKDPFVDEYRLYQTKEDLLKDFFVEFL